MSQLCKCASLRAAIGTAILVLLALLQPAAAFAAESLPTCTPVVARVVSVQGLVEVQRAGSQRWLQVTRLDTPICQGDLIHTQPRSRAALVILPEKFLRLDQNSALAISVTADETVVEFFQDTPRDSCGAGYFVTRFPRKFKVKTPFLNAAVEGTEFLVNMTCSTTTVAVFEGKVSAQTVLASTEQFFLKSGESVSAGPSEPAAVKLMVKPTDAVQWALYYPPLSDPAPEGTPTPNCDDGATDERSRCLTLRAERRLREGRVDEAQMDIEAAVALVADNPDTDSLLAIISVVKNDKARALNAGQQATRLAPTNPRAWIALSYAQQAEFKLEDALSSAQRAAELAPTSSTAQARVAELLMSVGNTKDAERAAEAAVAANPNESRAHMVLGFVHLAQIDAKKAREDFLSAIERDSTEPLARLGLGLAMIREGKLAEGREQIEIAVMLDPTNSLVRSYVGKAYYEENTKERDALAASQFEMAKQLDPNDPTPWFYDAILKRTQNRPIEALEDLQQSIDRNDDRAVYRSRLMLDSDAASRTAGMATVYQDLEFDAMALNEASVSLGADPTSSSAHAFMADYYLTQPRNEMVYDSETLQAQLLQPLVNNPPQPRLANSGLIFTDTATPFRVGFNDFDDLYTQSGTGAKFDGLVGSQDTWAASGTVSGLFDNVLVSVGGFHYETAGFRENNDQRLTTYNAFVQVAATSDTSVQFELRHLWKDFGDTQVTFFDADNFSPSVRDTLSADSARIGLKHSYRPDAVVLLSASTRDQEDVFSFPPFEFQSTVDEKIYSIEGSHIHRLGPVTATEGISYFTGNLTDETVIGPLPPETTQSPLKYTSAYVYGSIPVFQGAMLTAGLSYDAYRDQITDRNLWSPKLGFVWRAGATTLRLAAFRTIKPRVVDGQTLAPVTLAGFPLLFSGTGELNGTDSEFLGIALERKFARGLTVGVQANQRTLNYSARQLGASMDSDVTEQNAQLYLYKTFGKGVAARVGYNYRHLDGSDEVQNPFFTSASETHQVPLGVQWFLGNGLNLGAQTSYFNQRGTFLNSAQGYVEGNSQFWLTDAWVTYKLPRRLGAISFQVNNVFDQRFQFQEINPQNSLLPRKRVMLIKVELAL